MSAEIKKESPERRAELDQIERYRFSVTFPGAPYGPLVVDEPPPVGGDAGPSPAHALATAVGHCLSSTFFNTLERAHVRTGALRTTVDVEMGPNARGRRRVRRMTVEIHTQLLDEGDREGFNRCVEIFEDYCPVSGAVREGVTIDARVTAGASPPSG
ncbi:MAG: OsmC family protein [Thermoplasmata archaeon]|nr:OsmC family protein [Thermoplasmata archaeon]MCI4355783.1 OsmC family protein [Thermoplasmata archaeon]